LQEHDLKHHVSKSDRRKVEDKREDGYFLKRQGILVPSREDQGDHIKKAGHGDPHDQDPSQ